MLSQRFEPVQKSERIQLLDVLRGIAILGIFIMNLEAFTFYWALDDAQRSQVIWSAHDHKTEFLQWMFLEGKFYSIFSLLFGIGFAIYLSKATETKNVLALFKRRLFILLVIGFMHLLLWTGDIVAFYAVLGFVLIPFRRFSNKALLIIAALFILSPIGWYALKMSNPAIFNLSQWPYKWGEGFAQKAGIESGSEFYEAMQSGNFLQMLKLNLIGIFFRYGDLIFQNRAFKVLGMFMIGLVIGRVKFYNHLKENQRLLWIILIAGLIIGLPANYFWAKLKSTNGLYQFNMDGLKQTIAYALGVAPLALAYSSLVALMYVNSSLRKLLNLMAPAGKMALTNYFIHSLVGLFLFTGLGLSLKPIGPTAWTVLAVVVFLIQVISSTAWFRFFNYGPLEWLWRSATYKKWQPLRKVEGSRL